MKQSAHFFNPAIPMAWNSLSVTTFMSSEAVSSLSWRFRFAAAASDLNSSACSCAKFAGTWEEAMTSCTPLQGRLHKEFIFQWMCSIFGLWKYISVIFWETMNAHWWFFQNRILAVYSRISLEANFLSLICKIRGNFELWYAEKSWENKVGKFPYFLDLRRGFVSLL